MVKGIKEKELKKKKKVTIVDVLVILLVIALLATAGYLLYKEFFPNNVPVLKMQVQTSDGIDWDKLRAINPDTVGWLKIDGTSVDTPVVQTSDNSRYLNESFDGGTDQRGTPFLDKDYVWSPRSRNSVVYGHSIFNVGGHIHVMFDDLHNYVEDSTFYAGHSIIEYDRPAELGGNGKWQIVAVFRVEADVDYRRPDFTSEAEFMAYYQNLIAKSEVNTGQTVSPGDEMLTLSTCTEEGIFADGRLAVIAKRIS